MERVEWMHMHVYHAFATVSVRRLFTLPRARPPCYKWSLHIAARSASNFPSRSEFISAGAFWSFGLSLAIVGSFELYDWIATVGSATIDDFVGIAPCEVQLQASGEGPLI